MIKFFLLIKTVEAAEFYPVNTTELINAINQANLNPNEDIINLSVNTTYELTAINNNDPSANGLPLIASDITINGNNSTIIRNSSDNFRIFTVVDQGKLSLYNIILNNGSSTGGAGGGSIYIRGNGTLFINDSKLINNYVYPSGSGGAIQKRGTGNLEINNSEFSDNYAQNAGGAIYINHSGETTINNSVFNNNSTDDYGGAIRNHTGKLIINNASFFNNKALATTSYGYGGAIANEPGGEINISYSLFNNNTATKNGGGIYNTHVASVNNSCFENNSNYAVYNNSSTIISAANNYWGDPSGPGGVGPGSGDSVSTSVEFSPWLTACPEMPGGEKLPVVLVPGLGASWNTAAMLTGTADGGWKATPFVKVYDNLRATFLNAGYEESVDYFEFYYDWRQPVETLDDRLNDFIVNTVLAGKLADTKLNLIGHSLGGLVARTWAQNFGQISLNRLVTAGTPHGGAIPAYLAWAGAEVGDRFSWHWLALQLYLRLHQGQYASPVAAVQNLAPGLKDLLPIFDFTLGTPVTPVNNFLPGLTAPVSLAIAGSGQETIDSIPLGPRTLADKLLNRWPDGRPLTYQYTGEGDRTVLEKSAVVNGSDQQIVNADHTGLTESETGIQAILDGLELDIDPAAGPASPALYPSLFFFLHSPADLKVTGPDSQEYNSDADKLLLITNALPGDYQLEITGDNTGNYSLEIAQLTDSGEIWYSLFDDTAAGAVDQFNLHFEPMAPLVDPVIDPTGQTKLRQAKLRLAGLKESLGQTGGWYMNVLTKILERRPLTALEMLYGLARHPRLNPAEIDDAGQLILAAYAADPRPAPKEKLIQREIKLAQAAKARAERRLARLSNRPRLGQIYELAEINLNAAQNPDSLPRAYGQAVIAKTLFRQL